MQDLAPDTENDQPKSITRNGSYPVTIKVFGILNVIFGVMGFCGALGGIISVLFLEWASQNPDFSSAVSQQMSEDHLAYLQIMMFPAFALAVLLFICGIGLLQKKEWGRKWSIIYGVLGMLQSVINAVATTLLTDNTEQIFTAYFGGIFNIAFSVCILYFLSRENVITALNKSKIN